MAWQAITCAIGITLTAPALAMADPARFDIASQPVPAALTAFAKQANMQVLYQYDAIADVEANAVSGELEKHAALEQLLKDTGLEAVYSSENSATVRRVEVGRGTAAEAAGGARDVGVRLSQADAGQNAGTADETKDSAEGGKLEEVVVTAQKRKELLQEVPIPMTVLVPEELEIGNLTRLEDYFTQVPGLSIVSTGGNAGQTIAIRGLTTGGDIFTAPTVGIVIDDVSYGSSLGTGSGSTAVDIDPGDLQRVEILRGPQGTLYGASSLGGLIKYVTKEPELGVLSGRISAGANVVYSGDDLGYVARGSVNVPLGETVAIRASGFSHWEPGYIDNVASGGTNVNSREGQGGKITALWRPSESFSLKLGALQQDVRSDALSKIHIIPGVTEGLEQSVLPGTDTNRTKTQAYTATIDAKLGRLDLVSLTSFSINDIALKYDLPFFGFIFSEPLFGVPAAASIGAGKTDKFTQEFRASLPIGESIEWMVGGMFTEEKISALEDYGAYNSDGTFVAQLILLDTSTTFTEYAGFSNFTFAFNDAFDIQFGARATKYRTEFSTVRSGLLADDFFGTNLVVPKVDSADTAITYLVTPRLRLSPDHMIYARFATGYRPGGPNVTAGIQGIPTSYGSDTTQNYEVGIKGSLFGGGLAYDLAAYYIDWKDIQLPAVNFVGYTDNAGAATSQGIELSAKWKSDHGLAISGWFALNDAELSEPFPPGVPLVSTKGDRLPYGSAVSGNFSVDQTFDIGPALQAHAGLSASYVGERKDIFNATGPRGTFPSYTQVDAIAGIQGNSWSANIFVNNVLNKIGALYSGNDIAGRTSLVINQPRTAGITLTKDF